MSSSVLASFGKVSSKMILRLNKRIKIYKYAKLSILCLLILTFVTGCMPSLYSKKQGDALYNNLTAKVDDWFEDNLPDASVDSYKIEPGFVDTNDNTTYIFGNTLSEAMYGNYMLDGETHHYFYVPSSNKMYTDDLSDEALVIATDIYISGLGFSSSELLDPEENLMSDEKLYSEISSMISYNLIYDSDDDGNLDTFPSNKYQPYLPYDVTSENVDDYVKTHLAEGTLRASGITVVLDRNIELGELRLNILRECPGFDDNIIYTPDQMYQIYIDYKHDSSSSTSAATSSDAAANESYDDINNKTINICVSDRKKSAANTSTASDTSAATSAGTSKSHVYVYDMKTLRLINDYETGY